METLVHEDIVVVRSLKDIGKWLDDRFEKTLSIDYLEAKNKIEEAVEVIVEK